MCLGFAGAVSAQRPQPEVGVSYLGSTTLVEALPQFQGGQWSSDARAWAAPSPAVSMGVRLPVRPRLSVAAVAVAQPTQLRVEDVAGEREDQGLTVWSGLLEARYLARAPLVLSGGVGVLSYRGDGTGLLADGSDVSPLARLGAGASRSVGRHLATVRALLEYHRFGTGVLRANGGGAARVLRYGAEVTFSWGGGR